MNQLKKIQAFDVNKTLQDGMNQLAQTTLCVPIIASYKQLTKIINTLVGPVALMKAQVIAALDNNAVMDALNDASQIMDIVNQNIALPTLQINGETLDQMNLFKKICLDFDEILPNGMKKLIDRTADNINDAYDEMFDWPDDIMSMIERMQIDLRDHALSEAFDEGINKILSPIEKYRAYIKSTGILGYLERLQKFEKCMSNPKGCNRPRKELLFPNTNKYNSQYYMDLFAINLRGEVLLSKLSGQVRGVETKMSKTLKKLDAFRQPIRR